MRKITAWITTHKNEIIVGIIVFLITTVLSNLGSWIVNSGPTTGKSILTFLWDYVFYCASHQNLFNLVVFLVVSLFFVYFSYINIMAFKAISATQKAIDLAEIESMCESLDNEQLDEEAKKSKVADAKNKLDKFKKKYKQKQELKPQKTKRSLARSLAFLFIVVLYMIFYVFIPAVLYNAFDITITQVSPYTEESEITMLRSQWVSMKSYDDFRVINNRLLEIRTENDLIK